MTHGLRCPSCGHVIWSLRWAPGPGRTADCPLCGTELRPERRHPGRDRRRTADAAFDERRTDDRRYSVSQRSVVATDSRW